MFGFDHFAGLTQFTDKDGRKDDGVAKVEGGYKATREEIEALVEIHNADNDPGTKRCILIDGDIKDTLPKFLEQNPGLKIALLHFDMDLYEPTKIAMETLYPLVLKGGVVCFDEYGLVPWGGETTAVDEYFAKHGEAPIIKKFSFAQTPHGYFIKLLTFVTSPSTRARNPNSFAALSRRSVSSFSRISSPRTTQRTTRSSEPVAGNQAPAPRELAGQRRHRRQSQCAGEARSAACPGHYPGNQDSPFFYAILADTKLLEISKACLNCETLLSIHDIAQFRIDPPNHDERNFEWHQDFQYNVMSMNSATIWYPLKRVSAEMGPLVVVPGSHRTIVPVEMNFEGHQPGSGLMHAVLRFDVDEREAERKAVVLCAIEEGDVIVSHSLILHRSGANRSKRSRWTVNPRFGDAAIRHSPTAAGLPCATGPRRRLQSIIRTM